MPTSRVHGHARVIDDLNALRDGHRLAVHMWEQSLDCDNPSYSLNWLSLIAPEQITPRLQRGTMPLLSMSLMPSSAGSRNMVPYGLPVDNSMAMGYLIDLGQTAAESAKIARASWANLDSGMNPKFKNSKLHVPTGIAALDALYAPRRGQTIKGMEASAMAAFTEQQLDAVGRHIDQLPTEDLATATQQTGSDVFRTAQTMPNNEILVAAHRRHIRAIIFPDTATPASPAWLAPVSRLCMALAGLGNLQRGLDVPVVCYRLDDTPPGGFHFFAQGERALRIKATEALQQLARDPALLESYREHAPRACDKLASAVQRQLDIDITTLSSCPGGQFSLHTPSAGGGRGAC